MMFCPKCGMQVQENVSFCPNCGTALPRTPPFTPSLNQLHDSTVPPVELQKETEATGLRHSIKAGFYGLIITIIINLLLPIYLHFIPSFLATILVIYIFRLGSLKDGLITSFITTVFNDALLNTMGLAFLYLDNNSYTWSVDIWSVFSPIVNAAMIVIAAYIGVWLVTQKSKNLSPST